MDEQDLCLIAGDIDHGDSLGSEGHVPSGGCQWMTTGSVINHRGVKPPGGPLWRRR
jgi:quercetin 2,3-dioxygenase